MYKTRILGKTAVAALLAVLVVSCAGAKPAIPTPTAAPPATVASIQPTATPAPPAETLVTGSRDSLLSNPEADKSVNVEFIVDASGSMLQMAGDKSKMTIAKDVLSRLIRDLPSSIKVGLRVYGHRVPESDKARSCEDIELLAPLASGNAQGLSDQLDRIRPSGWTPIGRSLEEGAKDMAGLRQNINNIVLLSDGDETCDGKPAEVAQKLKEQPEAITVHTVGFAIDENARQHLQDVAQASGGTYNEAQDDQSLLDAVNRALLAARSGTFLRAEVTGESERRVASSIWLQDPKTGQKLHEFRSWIDSPVAPGTYDILVGTAPRVSYRNVEIKAHTKTTIKLSTGSIRVELADPQGQPMKAIAHLQDRATGTNLRDFQTWYNQPVLPGSYDVVVEANPTVTRRGVTVGSQQLAVLDLRRANLKIDAKGLGGEKPTWETELRDPENGQAIYRSLVGRDQSIIAGNYRLVVMAVPQITMDVSVNPGESKSVQLATGILRVELLDKVGQRMKTAATIIDTSQKEISGFNTWEDVKPLAGSYQLVLHTQPEIRQQIQVSGTDPTILKVRAP